MQKIVRRRWGILVGCGFGFLIFVCAFAGLRAQDTPATAVTDGPLGHLADWVIASGKATVLNAPAAHAMGLGNSELPMHGQAFKPPTDDLLHIVLVGTSQGHTDIVLTHTTLGQVGPMWLTSPSGKLRVTVYEDEKGVRVVTDGRYDADFETQKAYLLSKIPAG